MVESHTGKNRMIAFMKLRKVAGYPLTALNVFALVAW